AARRRASRQEKVLHCPQSSGNLQAPHSPETPAAAPRVTPLPPPGVGHSLTRRFVSTYVKVATFQIVGKAKQGGNVASYFCTPDGRVLHAVAGPVDAKTLLREARWVVDAYKLVQQEQRAGDDHDKLRTTFARFHADRLRAQYGLDLDANGSGGRRLDNQGRVHLLLAAAPLPRVAQVYKLVFEKILNEKISTSPVIEGGK